MPAICRLAYVLFPLAVVNTAHPYVQAEQYAFCSVMHVNL